MKRKLASVFSVFTRKAQVLGPDGKTIAEIKGTIREIEVYPIQPTRKQEKEAIK